MVLFGAAALAIATYLAITKLSGAVPACGPLKGCETVNTSRYSEFLGVPVAVFGAFGSAALTVAALAWWRRAARAALYVVYGVGMVAVAVLAYLTYLELFVIGAVCVWCVGYAIATASMWLTAVAAVRGPRRSPSTDDAAGTLR
jgi:uncharacterized membrane protein